MYRHVHLNEDFSAIQAANKYVQGKEKKCVHCKDSYAALQRFLDSYAVNKKIVQCKQNKCAHDKQNKLPHTSNKSVHDCKLKFQHAANKITGLAQAGRREGLRPSQAFPGFAAYMASFLRKELQAAVREEISRYISSTGTAASSNSNSTTPTAATSTDSSGSSGETSRLAEENSGRTLSFNEFYAR